MKYKMIFDVVNDGYRNGDLVLLGCFFIIMSLISLYYYWQQADLSKVLWWAFLGVLMIVWTGSAFWGTYSEYTCLKKAVINGNYEIVEGVITELSHVGRSSEKIIVNGHSYEYSTFIVTAGFNLTQHYGGPLHKGLQVRIVDVNGVIARLEIAEETK